MNIAGIPRSPRRSGFGLIEAVAPIKAYVDRWNARPTVKRVAQIDADLLKAQGNS